MASALKLWVVEVIMEKPQVMNPKPEMKPDFYGPAHKGQRAALFKIATDAGRADYTDQKSLDSLKTQLAVVDKNIRGHALWEEKALHPPLARESAQSCGKNRRRT